MYNFEEHNQYILELFIHKKIEKFKKNCSPALRHAYLYSCSLKHFPVRLRENSILPVNQYTYWQLPIIDVYKEWVGRECDFLVTHKRSGIDFLKKYQYAEKSGLIQRFPPSHTTPSFKLLFHDGFERRKELARKYYERPDISDDQRDFYWAVCLIINAVQFKIREYSLHTDDYKKQQALLWLEKNPPRNFYEGIVMIALFHEFIAFEDGMGSHGLRLDQILIDFYRRDCQSGLLDRSMAIRMLEDLFMFFDTYGERSANITIGGSTPDGRDLSNELTEMIMQVSARLHLDVPMITLRVNPEMPDNIWDDALQLISTGVGFPAFYNDVAVIRAKKNAGISEKDAYDYSTLGCVETTIGGKEYSQTEGLRLNWLKILEIMLDSLVDDGNIAGMGQWPLKEYRNSFNSFADFYYWYCDELIYATNEMCRYVDMAEDANYELWPLPLLSVFVDGALEKGKDITHHGAEYETLTINGAGVASTVDSLQAIEEIVFKKHELTLRELAQILRRNFQGHEELRQKLLACPKFGNDVPDVDQKAEDLMRRFTAAINHYRRKYGAGKMQSGFYTVMHHYLLGLKTGASPDGRRAGESLSNSLSPSQGMDTTGPTAVMNSVNRISTAYMGNGMALDMKFLPSFLKTGIHRIALRSMIEVYFKRGGMELQLNVVDRDTLIKAQKQPDRYKHLVVRVSGYSAYFVSLERGLQDEIIRRTAYGA